MKKHLKLLSYAAICTAAAIITNTFAGITASGEDAPLTVGFTAAEYIEDSNRFRLDFSVSGDTSLSGAQMFFDISGDAEFSSIEAAAPLTDAGVTFVNSLKGSSASVVFFTMTHPVSDSGVLYSLYVTLPETVSDGDSFTVTPSDSQTFFTDSEKKAVNGVVIPPYTFTYHEVKETTTPEVTTTADERSLKMYANSTSVSYSEESSTVTLPIYVESSHTFNGAQLCIIADNGARITDIRKADVTENCTFFEKKLDAGKAYLSFLSTEPLAEVGQVMYIDVIIPENTPVGTQIKLSLDGTSNRFIYTCEHITYEIKAWSFPEITINVTDKPFIAGDVNANGRVDANDALMVLKHIAFIQQLSETEYAAADVDGNGSVDSFDAVQILKLTAFIGV